MTEKEILNSRYQLISHIGRGSFGEVWMAKDLQLDITVAVKVYAALDGKGITEFKDEFKNVYKLHHPNLLRPDYFDTIGNNPYLVMPYCPKAADDLAGRMTEHELWRFIRDVASGLAYLHDNDVIHRDIKPENILQDERGDYVISDFGLSTKMRSTLRQASMRQNDGFSGTIAYMAPELFTSKPTAVKATDVWALGVTIYEMATGELPFCGQGGCMLNAGAEIPELDSTKWSNRLNEVMRLCLAKDTWDRPTAEDLAEYSKLVMNGDKRTWSQWKGGDNPKPVPKPSMSLLTVWRMLLGGMSAIVICYFILVRLFHNDDTPTVDGFKEETQSCISEIVDVRHVTNLSLSGTANCYIVSSAGRYKFKTVKGNSTESVGSVVSCEVLWESFGTDETPTVGDLVYDVSYDDDGYIEFEATARKGNAVIAAKDAEGKILWSWHIWLTDMPEEQVYFNNAGTMMDRNLGATSAVPGDVGALGLLYQWGRKDPFLGSSSIKTAITAKSTLSWPTAVDCTSSTGTIDYSVLHPTTFIKGDNINSDWCKFNKGDSWIVFESINIRWSCSKSLYDPCPVGWRVPDGGESGVWAQASGSPNRDNYTYDSINEGMNFSGEFGASSNIWYPASYCRMHNSGDFYEGEKFGNWWSSSRTDDNLSYKLTFSYAGWYNSSDFSNCADGRSVRCVKDTEGSSKDLNYRSKSKNLSVDEEASKDKPHFGLG